MEETEPFGARHHVHPQHPGAFGCFTGTVGDFSNFGTAQANVQANVRVEF